jgi:hypothetical protein
MSHQHKYTGSKPHLLTRLPLPLLLHLQAGLQPQLIRQQHTVGSHYSTIQALHTSCDMPDDSTHTCAQRSLDKATGAHPPQLIAGQLNAGWPCLKPML